MVFKSHAALIRYFKISTYMLTPDFISHPLFGRYILDIQDISRHHYDLIIMFFATEIRIGLRQ